MHRTLLIFLIFGLAASVGAAVAFALLPRSSDILISHGVAAPIDGKADAVRVYVKIQNSGGPDMLLSADSPIAESATLYSPEAENGIPIPAESQPSLAVDGAHVVLSGLETPVGEGQLIPVSFTFQNAGSVSGKARLVREAASGQRSIAGLFGFGGICLIGDGEPAPSVALNVSAGADKTWKIELLSEEFEFRQDLLDGPHVPGTGHGHLYVGGLKLQRLFRSEVETGELPPGNHVFRVTLNTNDHRAYVVDDEPVTATANVRVN